MGIDQTERRRQKAADSTKRLKHPYAAIEHRVIDSDSYADLSFSAKALLTLLTRQLTKDNNGHLQASFAWCKRFGFGSEHTLRKALAELLSHGLVCRTRSHGANGAWAKYAVTWLPVVKREGLYLDGFKTAAWRDWVPPDKKSSPQKLPEPSSRKCSFSPQLPAESAGTPPAKTAAYELMPCRERKPLDVAVWIPGYLGSLVKDGQTGNQRFQILEAA